MLVRICGRRKGKLPTHPVRCQSHAVLQPRDLDVRKLRLGGGPKQSGWSWTHLSSLLWNPESRSTRCWKYGSANHVAAQGKHLTNHARVCHGLRLTKQDHYFCVNFDHFLNQAFGGSWDSIENWVEPETKPPSENLACTNLWNALYQVSVFDFKMNWFH